MSSRIDDVTGKHRKDIPAGDKKADEGWTCSNPSGILV